MPSFQMDRWERGRVHGAVDRAASGPDPVSTEVTSRYVRENRLGFLAQCVGSCYGCDISKGGKAAIPFYMYLCIYNIMYLCVYIFAFRLGLPLADQLSPPPSSALCLCQPQVPCCSQGAPEDTLLLGRSAAPHSPRSTEFQCALPDPCLFVSFLTCTHTQHL